MGCNSSKVSKTHVEILRIRQEVKTSVKWWKKKKKECQQGPKSGLDSDVRPLSPSNTPLSSTCDDSEERTTVEGIVDDGKIPNHQEDRMQCKLSADSIESCQKFLLAAVSGSDGGQTPAGLGALPPLNARKSMMANDLTVEEIEDSSNLSEDIEQLTRSKTGTCTPTESHHVPLVVHAAWSDFSVRQRNSSFAPRPKTKVKKFHSSEHSEREGKSLTDRRNRPMAAKGERKRPELTAVYGAELSIPGTPVPNPKRQEEESCLNAWMARRLDDEC